MQQELSLKEPEIRQLLEKGDKLVKESSPTTEVRAIADKVGELQGEWTRLQQEVTVQDSRLTMAGSHAQQFTERLDKMAMWLQMTEEKLEKMKPEDVDQNTVVHKLKELQVGRLLFLRLIIGKFYVRFFGGRRGRL